MPVVVVVVVAVAAVVVVVGVAVAVVGVEVSLLSTWQQGMEWAARMTGRSHTEDASS